MNSHSEYGQTPERITPRETATASSPCTFSTTYERIMSHRRENYVYLSRRFSLRPLHTNDLPLEHLEMPNKITAIVFQSIELTVPFAYVYISLICVSGIKNYYYPDTLDDASSSTLFGFILPLLIETRTKPFLLGWAIFELLFYVFQKCHLFYLQRKDPLECAFQSAPLQTIEEREQLWVRCLNNVKLDPVKWITGWFFDAPFESISHYDMIDFLTWSMFETRGQEHLTSEEIKQLNRFVSGTEKMFQSHFGQEDFHFHESNDDKEVFSFSRIIEHVNRSAEATRNFYRDHTTSFHSSPIVQRLYKNGVHAYEHGQEYYDQFSETTIRYISENSSQLTKFIDSSTRPFRKQLEHYKEVLENARKMPLHAGHMASLLNEISDIGRKLHGAERKAVESVRVTGKKLHDAEKKALKSVKITIQPLFQTKRALRYAKYSEDPLVGVHMYPLFFHMLMYFCTDTLLRGFLRQRKFERKRVGKLVYYYYCPEDVDLNATPIVFCHGIGVGIFPYLAFIDRLAKLKRPLYLPEINYVSGFRILQNLNTDTILPPHSVVSHVVSMMAKHGHSRAVFSGHSYGTTWLSYIAKYAKRYVEGLIFLDPICFCLHDPHLTKQFVYHRANPGSVSYIIRSDVHVHWTIQRCFPWKQISLFVEQISCPAAIFFSENDSLVPISILQEYLEREGVPIMNDGNFRIDTVNENPISSTLLRNTLHGDYIESSHMMDIVVSSIAAIGCDRKSKAN